MFSWQLGHRAFGNFKAVVNFPTNSGEKVSFSLNAMFLSLWDAGVEGTLWKMSRDEISQVVSNGG